MTDLIERLRNRYCSQCELERGAGTQSDMQEAADEIERLTAENKELDDLNYVQAGMIAEMSAALEKIAIVYPSDGSVAGPIAREALKDESK